MVCSIHLRAITHRPTLNQKGIWSPNRVTSTLTITQLGHCSRVMAHSAMCMKSGERLRPTKDLDMMRILCLCYVSKFLKIDFICLSAMVDESFGDKYFRLRNSLWKTVSEQKWFCHRKSCLLYKEFYMCKYIHLAKFIKILFSTWVM